jgi:hypothetical protein
LRRVQRMKTAFLPTTANTSARGVWLASPQQASGGAIEPPVVPCWRSWAYFAVRRGKWTNNGMTRR